MVGNIANVAAMILLIQLFVIGLNTVWLVVSRYNIMSLHTLYCLIFKQCMEVNLAFVCAQFISGKVFMHTEHGLRPVRIDFLGGPMSSHIKRLKGDHPKLARNRSRRSRLSQVITMILFYFLKYLLVDSFALKIVPVPLLSTFPFFVFFLDGF